MATVPWSIGRDLIERRSASGERPSRRSLYACGLLVAGYWIAAYAAPSVASTWWLALAPALLIGGLLRRGWACRVLLAAAVVLLGAGWYSARVNERAAESLARAIQSEAADGQPLLVMVRGVVIDVPRRLEGARGALGHTMPMDPATGFTLALSGVDVEGIPRPASGEMRVRVEDEPDKLPTGLRCGAPITLTGRLRPVKGASNPGEPDWLALAAQDGRVGDLDVAKPELIAVRSPEGRRETARSWWHGLIGRLHERCVRAIDGPISAPGTRADPERVRSRALLGALLLGERDAALDDVNSAFTRLGLLHLVAISGFNLAVMAGAAMFGLRLTGDRGWLEPAGVALLVGLYMLVLPAQAPILRAGILVLVLLVAEAAGRRYDRATLLGWIAFVLLIVRPLDAWSLGFQLSFGIVAALLLLGTTVHHRLWGVPILGLSPVHEPHGRVRWWTWMPGVWQWLTRAMKAQVSASILAWAVSIPIIACHTGQVGLLTPLMTLIVLPLTVVVLWGGYIALLAGVIVPAAAGITGGVLDWMARVLVEVVMLLDRVPGASIQMPRVSAWWALACVAGVVCFVLRGTLRERWAWAIAAALAAWLGGELYFATRLPPSVAFRIDTLAVGDGSCHLLRRGSDAVLWDCGSLSTGVGERLIPEAVRALGAWRVPTVVVTHAHIDHFACLPDVVDALGVRLVYVPAQLERYAAGHPGSAPAELLVQLKARSVNVRTLGLGDSVDLAGVHADVLWPPRDREFKNANDSSIVVAIDVPGTRRRVLLTGDASRESLSNLLPDVSSQGPGTALRADVLELPHHGAFIEQAVELVHVVDPRVVLQSTGARRPPNPAWAGVMTGRAWYATPTAGAAWIEIRADGTIASGSFR